MPGRDPGPSGVLLLDKSPGITSTRALAAAKRLLGSRKAGHTGTLDPFATGLLPIAFREATKFSRFLLDSRKGYLATLQLGRVTTTGDPEGEVLRDQPALVERAKIDAVVASFVGVQLQVPPMHSALHHQGKRLYEWAREGVSIDRAPREIEIHSIEVVSNVGENLVISVNCSKGTYIRALAVDLGERLGCGATLTALRRTRVGRFTIDDAVTLDALEAMGTVAARGQLRPPAALVEGLHSLALDAEATRRFGQGQAVACSPGTPPGELALFGPEGVFLGVGWSTGQGSVEPRRLLAERQQAP